MLEKIPLTPEGSKKINEELKTLKTFDRPAIINAIAEARAHGDLSENAEYSAAKEKQGFIEAKITYLENMIARSEIIDVSTISGNTIKFGATVTFVDEETDLETTYKILNDYEADIQKGYISYASPIGRGLIGKKVGDSVEINTPKGVRYYEIIAVSYK